LRLLFDHNVPAPLRRLIPGHDIIFADERGWGELTNGDLLAAAEAAGLDVLLTADRNLRYQQNLTGRRIGLIVLSTNYWPVIRDNVPHILAAVEQAGRERYLEVDLPRPTLLRRPPPAANW
jgi:hypothetical protein